MTCSLLPNQRSLQVLGDLEIKVVVPQQEDVPGVNSYGVWEATYEICHSVRYKEVVVKGIGKSGAESYSKPAVFEYEFEDMKGRWDLCERAKKKRLAELQPAKQVRQRGERRREGMKRS